MKIEFLRHYSALLGKGGALALYLWSSGTTFAQKTTDCRGLIVQACEALRPVANQQHLPVQELQILNITTYRVSGNAKLQQTRRQLTWLHQADQTLLIDGPSEVYILKNLQVAINHKQHSILITQPNSPTKPAADWILHLKNQLSALQVLSCKVASVRSVPHRYIRLTPLAASPLFKQIASVEYVLVGTKPAFQQMTTFYLPDQTVSSASMQLLSQQWKKQDTRLAQPVLERLFDGGGKLRPAYRHYTVSDYRTR